MPDLHQPASSPSHPLFVDGKRTSSLQQQAAALLLLKQRASHVSIHRLLGVNHKFLETLSKNLRDVRKQWVEEKEKNIIF